MTRTEPSVLDMFRALPVRSFVLSVLPVVAAALQAVNVAVNGLPVEYGATFAAGMVACSVAATRQHLASFRTRTLEENWLN